MMGPCIDSIKFAGGAFTVITPKTLRVFIDTAHQYGVLVYTGGFMEYVLTQGKAAVKKHIHACQAAGFYIIELSAGFITLSTDDWLRLIGMVQQAGSKAKPEVAYSSVQAVMPVKRLYNRRDSAIPVMPSNRQKSF